MAQYPREICKSIRNYVSVKLSLQKYLQTKSPFENEPRIVLIKYQSLQQYPLVSKLYWQQYPQNP
jgi:hypothetical protein